MLSCGIWGWMMLFECCIISTISCFSILMFESIKCEAINIYSSINCLHSTNCIICCWWFLTYGWECACCYCSHLKPYCSPTVWFEGIWIAFSTWWSGECCNVWISYCENIALDLIVTHLDNKINIIFCQH